MTMWKRFFSSFSSLSVCLTGNLSAVVHSHGFHSFIFGWTWSRQLFSAKEDRQAGEHLLSWQFSISALNHVDTTQIARIMQVHQLHRIRTVQATFRKVTDRKIVFFYGPRCSLNRWVFRLWWKMCRISQRGACSIIAEPGQQAVMVLLSGWWALLLVKEYYSKSNGSSRS